MAVDDPYAAYCIDEAVAWFGQHVEKELSKIEAKSKKEQEGKELAMLRRLLGDGQRFADPVAMGLV